MSTSKADQGTAAESAGRRGVHSGDLWAAVATVVLGVVGIVGALQIFVPRGGAALLSPRTAPIAVAVAVTALGVLLLVRALRRGDAEPTDLGSLRKLGMLAAVLGTYLLAFLPLGFLTATALLTTFLFHRLGERRIWLAALVGILLSVALTELFARVLSVALPVGPLGF